MANSGITPKIALVSSNLVKFCCLYLLCLPQFSTLPPFLACFPPQVIWFSSDFSSVFSELKSTSRQVFILSSSYSPSFCTAVTIVAVFLTSFYSRKTLSEDNGLILFLSVILRT